MIAAQAGLPAADGRASVGEINRREALKRAAVAGGVLWAAPAIHTVAAHAAGSGPPVPCVGGGGISGQVTDATTATGIDGALVSLDSGADTTLTDGQGNYS